MLLTRSNFPPGLTSNIELPQHEDHRARVTK
jgi:hypothetical protein